MTPILEVERVGKAFGSGSASHFALADISFDVPPGQTVAVVGESGAGKSTLSRLVLRLLKPDTGSVRLAGEDFFALRGRSLRVLRRRIQAVFQDPFGSFDPHMSMVKAIGEPLRVQTGLPPSERRDRVLDLLDEVGLGATVANRRPYELSGGQLQRCAIARALATQPDLVVCDEAVAALDASSKAQVLNLLMDLQDRLGIAYLFVSHDIGIVRAIADWIVVMKGGHVVEQGPAEQVLHGPTHPYTAALLDAVPTPDPTVERARLDSRATFGRGVSITAPTSAPEPRVPDGRRLNPTACISGPTEGRFPQYKEEQ